MFTDVERCARYFSEKKHTGKQYYNILLYYFLRDSL